jgi:hypothetical protein
MITSNDWSLPIAELGDADDVPAVSSALVAAVSAALTSITGPSKRTPLVGDPFSFSQRITEVSVANGTVGLIQIAVPSPDPGYYTTAGVVVKTGIWALTLQIARGSAADVAIGGCIQTPARNGWDGRIYTGRYVDWNGVTRASCHWTGYLAAGETFGFYRANHSGAAQLMNTDYTISFVDAA